MLLLVRVAMLDLVSPLAPVTAIDDKNAKLLAARIYIIEHLLVREKGPKGGLIALR